MPDEYVPPCFCLLVTSQKPTCKQECDLVKPLMFRLHAETSTAFQICEERERERVLSVFDEVGYPSSSCCHLLHCGSHGDLQAEGLYGVFLVPALH